MLGPRGGQRFTAFQRLLVVAALVSGVIATPDARCEPITIKHRQGETTLSAVPKTVLTMDLATLETLDAIGVEPSGVIGSHIPDHLDRFRGDAYLKIGTLFEPDYEAINAAQPDLIIVAGRSSPKYAALSQIAPTIDLTVDDTKFLASAFENARTLGRIFKKEQDVERLIDDIEASVQKVRDKAKTAGHALILLTTGGRISAYGANSRFGTIHTDFGILPAIKDLDTAVHGQGVSFELIREANPDWLFVIDRDQAVGQTGQPARQLLDNALVHRTTAWKRGHVVYLDPVRWYLVSGGLVSLKANADQIAGALDSQR